MRNRLTLFKTFTDIEFYEENDEMNRNIEDLMTIASWEFFWSKGELWHQSPWSGHKELLFLRPSVKTA